MKGLDYMATTNDTYESFRDIIDTAENIVFFGGAGVSTESDIPDFRSESGLYARKQNKYSPEQMLHRQFFDTHPAEFYDFYFNKIIHPDAKPNPAHLALARLEQDGRLKAVVTQNIDGLHQKAGSRHVIELHGSILRNYCTACGEAHSLDELLAHQPDVPLCRRCSSIVKPDVVLYGEGLNEKDITRAVTAIEKAQVLIIGGTSLSVYPAAGLVDYYRGHHLIIINESPTVQDTRADLILRDKIGKVFAKLI